MVLINKTHHITTMSSIMHKQLINLNLRHFHCKHKIYIYIYIYILVKFQNSWQQIDLIFIFLRINVVPFIQ